MISNGRNNMPEKHSEWFRVSPSGHFSVVPHSWIKTTS